MSAVARWQDEIPATTAAISAAHFAVLEANMALAGPRFGAPGYGDRARVIDAAVLELTQGKWLYNRATGECADFAARTSSADDLVAARAHLQAAVELADASRAPDTQTRARAHAARAALRNAGTEILYAGEAPIVPSIAPIVVLHGSSRRMGAQYAQQCVEIFGRFVFEHLAARELDGETRTVLRTWETQMRAHTPELLEMAHGIAEGAQALGIALDYEHALAIWTDLLAPSLDPLPMGVLDAEGGAELGGYAGVRLPTGDVEGTCSGAAAWGAASADGRACFASSTDHDCTFQVTIVAYPDEGHAFVYTPFSVNGSIPGLGRFGLSGHPGFNAAGVTYVHHGGYESCAEPRELWGYGVPRGATTMHLLRYAGSAREALAMELEFPIGDAGRILGSAGGFYVDDGYGYVLEDRTPGRPVYREHTAGADGAEHDLLYATNNLLSPQLGHGFCPPPDGYEFAPDAGWYTLAPERVGVGDPGAVTRQWCTASSYARNRYLYPRLLERDGALTPTALADLFRAGPRYEVAAWGRNGDRRPQGELREGSVGGRHNAMIAWGSAASRSYSAAIGMLAPRDSANNGPIHGYAYFDETGAGWDLRLADDVPALVADARATAERDVARASALLEARADADVDRGALEELAQRASRELAAGVAADGESAGDAASDARVAQQARATRRYTRAQVRARQVIEALAGQEVS